MSSESIEIRELQTCHRDSVLAIWREGRSFLKENGVYPSGRRVITQGKKPFLKTYLKKGEGLY